MPARQAKHWCFTLNNYTDEDVQRLRELWDEDGSNCCYLVFGRETGESGTPHLQGFVTFAARKTLNSAKTLISQRAHLEPAKGTPKQAATYCKKDGDFEEFGVVTGGQGRRSDLSQVAEKIKAGTNIRTLADEHPEAILRYGSGINRLRLFYRPTREAPPQIWVFWGPTGVGKTRRVWQFTAATEMWQHPGDRWFDGYDQQPAVLFDDFDGSYFKLSYLLKLLDRYPFQVPVKNGFTWWCPKTIYITSNIEPKDWYPSAHNDHKQALLRRLNEFGTIEHVTAAHGQ